VPTLNAFDNGDTRAVVLILTEPIAMRDREGKPGGGKGLLMSNTAFTLSANNFHTLFIPGKEAEVEPVVFYGNRVDDIRVQGEVVNTLQARMGTGGGNMPLVAFPIDDGREVEKHQNGTGIGNAGDPAYTLDTRQHPTVATESIVRRLTPTECERLQGFPDDWTEGQTDGHRYKQMGNAVAVPVVSWLISRLVDEPNT
jgi:DNA (cytosine-5)-methyltransferase 1